MSKFFTMTGGLGLAAVGLALASEPVSSVSIPNPVSTPILATSLPAGLSAERFAALSKKSPFTLASTSEETVDFAKDLVLSGYFRMDGKDFVMVANRTRPDRLMVGTDPSPSAQGLVLVKVNRDPSGDPTKLKAQIRKGSETATIKYESSGPAAAPGSNAQPAAIPPPVPVPATTSAIPSANDQPPPSPVPAVVRRRGNPIPPPLKR